MIVLLTIIVLAMLAVLVYLVGMLVTAQQRQDQVLQARQTIDSIHDQTIRAMFDAARESGAFKKF